MLSFNDIFRNFGILRYPTHPVLLIFVIPSPLLVPSGHFSFIPVFGVSVPPASQYLPVPPVFPLGFPPYPGAPAPISYLILSIGIWIVSDLFLLLPYDGRVHYFFVPSTKDNPDSVRVLLSTSIFRRCPSAFGFYANLDYV